MNDSSLVTTNVEGTVPVEEMLGQMQLIQDYMKSVLVENHHYGKIPGCGDKPTLLKPGAEKLMFAFCLKCDYEIDIIEMENEHREYRIKCRIINKDTGMEVGQGVGSASTKESKWRFRSGVNELTEFDVPQAYWTKDSKGNRDAKKLIVDPSLEGLPLSTKKDENGKWKIAVKGEKVEHDNPSDNYNTVLKMAKKRAAVDGAISSTACSDIFTQDIEEIKENERAATGQATQETTPAEKTKKEKIKKPGQEAQDDSATVSMEQLQQIEATATRCGWDMKAVSAYIKDNFKKKSTAMTVGEANQLLKAIEPDDIPL